MFEFPLAFDFTVWFNVRVGLNFHVGRDHTLPVTTINPFRLVFR